MSERKHTGVADRLLCPRCFQSFAGAAGIEIDGEKLCPSCGDRARARPGVSAAADRPFRKAPPVSSALDPEPPAGGGSLARLATEMATWCRGRCWWARLPLWVYFASVLIRQWLHPGEYRSIFDGINLGIHELGHYLFQPLGRFLNVAGGTIAQCLAPLLAALVFLRQRDYFGIAVCFSWLATNLWEVAIYLGDARALKLPLVAPGVGLMPPGEGAGMHDWNYLLGVTGLLRHDMAIAWCLRLVSTGVMAAGLGLGAWLMLQMAIHKGPPPAPED